MTSDGEIGDDVKTTGGREIALESSPMDECPEDISCAIFFMDHKSAVLMYDVSLRVLEARSMTESLKEPE